MKRPVVLIDDDDDLRESLAEVLVARGYPVAAFSDAQEALAQMKAGLEPRLVFLDLMMPGMTGWQFREAQRQHPALAHIPVVVLTARRSVDAGPGMPPLDAEVLHKPFSTSALLEVVERYP